MLGPPSMKTQHLESDSGWFCVILCVFYKIPLTLVLQNCLFLFFHSLEAGMANVISSFKRRKKKNNNWMIRLTKHLSTQKYSIEFSDIPMDLKHAWKRIYTVPAAQRLIIRFSIVALILWCLFMFQAIAAK